MAHFFHKYMMLRKFKQFLSDLVLKTCFVSFIEVKLHPRENFFVRFIQVSDSECPLYRGTLWGFDPKTAGAKSFVLFRQISALDWFYCISIEMLCHINMNGRKWKKCLQKFWFNERFQINQLVKIKECFKIAIDLQIGLLKHIL